MYHMLYIIVCLLHTYNFVLQ